MSSSKPTAQQIAVILEEPDDGTSIEAVCRKSGISITTYYRWYKKYGALRPSKIKRLRQLESENARLKLLMAMWSFDKELSRSATPLQSFDPPRPSHGWATMPAPAEQMPPAGEASDQSPPPLGGANGHVTDAQFEEQAAPTAPRRQRLRVLLERAAAFAGWARAWIHLRAKGVSLGRIRELGQTIWTRAAKRSQGQNLVLVGIAGGLAAGFAFGMSSSPQESRPPPVPVDMTVRFNTHRSYVSAMGEGWKEPESWGTWMAGKQASVLLSFDGPARGDVELLLEVRSRPAKGSAPQTLLVRFNDGELGRWKLPSEPRELRRRFIVPQAVFNRSTAARLTFETANGTARPDEFGLRGLSLVDAVHLGRFKGYLDRCSAEKLVGWAVSEDSAVSVAATGNGEPLQVTFANVERPDLAPHGLPADAGFELTPVKPIAAGTLVEVRFANGQRLIGSPCRP